LSHTLNNPKTNEGRVAYLTTPKMSGKFTDFPSGKLNSIDIKKIKETENDFKIIVKTLEAELI